MKRLNYHHLRYFREVALDGRLGRTAQRLNVSQSALSIQIGQLEDSLGVALFERVSRSLILTEAGRIALAHADRIFETGDELLATLNQNAASGQPLRIGALSTLSRNFHLQFLRPLLARGGTGLWLKSGNIRSLLDDLQTLALDVVLATQIPDLDPEDGFAAQKIAEQPVGAHGAPSFMRHDTLAALLAHEPVILPTESVIRTGFEALAARLGVQPKVIATVDDMAMVRLLAREGVGIAIAPSVVLADELAGGLLATAPFDLGLTEPFYAITAPRRFPHPALAPLLAEIA